MKMFLDSAFQLQDLMSDMFRFCTARGPLRKKMELEMTVDRVSDREPKQTRLMVKCGGPEKAASLVTDWATNMGSLHSDLQKMVCDIDTLFGLVGGIKICYIDKITKGI